MTRGKKKSLGMGAFSVVIAVLLLICVVFYNGYIYNKIANFTGVSLNEVAIQQAFQFTSKFKADMTAVELLAADISRKPSHVEISKAILSTAVEKTDFDNLIVLNVKGRGYTSDGRNVDFADREFFQRSLAGKTLVSNDTLPTPNKSELLVASTPIIYKEEVCGVLVGTYELSNLNELFFSSFGGTGYAYIVTNDGTIISRTENERALLSEGNIYELLSEASFCHGNSYSDLRSDIEYSIAGEARYRHNNEARIMRYMPININDWSIVSIIPEIAVSGYAGEITITTLLMSTAIIATFGLLMARASRIQKRSMSTLEEIAYVDEMTNAPTMAKFKIEAQRFIDDNPSKKLLMVKFDIDKFKLVNQILGQEIGDKVIINLAKALKQNISPGYERYARLHDDEFMVLHEYTEVEDLIHIRDKYQVLFARLMGPEFEYNLRMVSGHYYMESENCKNAVEAMEKANIAHRRAKKLGTEICIYDEALISEELRHMDIEERMKAALDNDEFKVYLQPQYSLRDEKIAGAEALVRWQTPDGVIIYPDDFIPIFEENGFITTLDMYMFEQSCKIITSWLDEGVVPVVVSVNFSRKHLSNSNFVVTLCNIADSYSVPHKYLGIEITEGIFFDNKEVLLDVLDRLHEFDFTLIMDDFGTGYSSLGMLKNIPVDVIKIDKSFFEDMGNGARAQVVLGYMIKMAQALDIQTVSEGVETKEMVEVLRGFGCDIAQGYYYARPMPCGEFFELLKNSN